MYSGVNKILKSLLPMVGGIFICVACNSNTNVKDSHEEVPKPHPTGLEETDSTSYIQLRGKTQGTDYNIIYRMASGKAYKREIDSILVDFDNSLSTYNPGSILSEFNESGEVFYDKYFKAVLTCSKTVYEQTNHHFNPALYGLIDLWGVDYENQEIISREEIDSVLKICMLEDVFLDTITGTVKRNLPVKLEFNAIAQGYSVDVISEFLMSEGITDFLVEIGGEMRTSGKSVRNNWIVQIENPQAAKTKEGETGALKLTLKDRGLATSGSYRKYKIVDGKRYSHIIDPFKGEPAQNNLLSVTVIAENAALADAYATAFMVMGVEKTKAFVENHPDLNLDIFLIFDHKGQNNHYLSAGMKACVLPAQSL